jgi:hypothetical protein
MSNKVQAPTEADWDAALDLAHATLGDPAWVALAQAALRATAETDEDSEDQPTRRPSSAMNAAA